MVIRYVAVVGGQQKIIINYNYILLHDDELLKRLEEREEIEDD